jgi:hypothetical protein
MGEVGHEIRAVLEGSDGYHNSWTNFGSIWTDKIHNEKARSSGIVDYLQVQDLQTGEIAYFRFPCGDGALVSMLCAVMTHHSIFFFARKYANWCVHTSKDNAYIRRYVAHIKRLSVQDMRTSDHVACIHLCVFSTRHLLLFRTHQGKVKCILVIMCGCLSNHFTRTTLQHVIFHERLQGNSTCRYIQEREKERVISFTGACLLFV